MYYLNKVLDLMDTIFFVVRKSFKQITTLHVYHHCLMVMFTHGTFMAYGAGGQYAVIALLNSLVHMVMYSYYLFTALYPGSTGSLWWKKYITIMQLAQFTLIALQSLWVLIFNSSCQFPLIMHFIQLSQAGVMMAMFGNFYAKAYCGKKVTQAKSKKIDN
ncbi:very long chain fatty acid elongase 7-like [Drosophila tropicalis]|uniref:very long chain fatty acid elongase 7-like n=1 Tax=Drosophila tropicalis TaxID=46794 RepID=UPI0035AB9FFF